MIPIIIEQIGWSRRTFGPGPRVKGNTAHVLKELLEYREAPSIEEAVDIAMLGFDGLWRQAAEVFPDATDAVLAEMIAIEYDVKLSANKLRPFTPTPPDVPSEGRPGKWKPTDAVFDVLTERRRQVEGEGMTTAHDDTHVNGELAGAAACYALMATKHWGVRPAIDQFWPWARSWWKPAPSVRSMLVKAAALLIAEIERIDRRQ